LKESSGGETLFQICGAAEEKARCPKSVFILGTCRREFLEEFIYKLHVHNKYA